MLLIFSATGKMPSPRLRGWMESTLNSSLATSKSTWYYLNNNVNSLKSYQALNYSSFLVEAEEQEWSPDKNIGGNRWGIPNSLSDRWHEYAFLVAQ